MRGPVVETVMLLLLIVFFGIQQRQRPQLYFRIWTVGWMLVSLSLVIWDLDLRGAPARILLAQEMVRYDLIVLAGVAFAIALVVVRERLGRTVVRLGFLAFPAILGIDLQMVPHVPPALLKLLLLVLVAGSQVGGIVFAQVAIPSAWRARKVPILAICVGSTAWIAIAILRDKAVDVGDVIVTQIFLCAAVHSLATFKRTLAGVLGGIGFAGWGLFYVLPDINLFWHGALPLIYMYWNVPKYVVGFSMVLRVVEVDSEEKARLLRQVRILYNDFKGLYEGHPHPVWIANAADGRLLSTNQAAQELYGFTEDEFLAIRQGDLESPWDEEVAEVERLLPLPPEGTRTRHKRKDGKLIWMLLVERLIVFQGREARMVLARDITHALRVNRELAFRAQHDPLTGLPNRAQLGERLQECLATCERDGELAAVLAIDIDHFKQVNDTHGHIVGDACLRTVAARLQARIRQSDTIARTGGEEFVAVIGRLHAAEDAKKLALGLLQLFEQTIVLEECELAVTVSIGVAMYPEDGVRGEDLWQQADDALYEAKLRGRNCVVMAQEMVVVGELAGL